MLQDKEYFKNVILELINTNIQDENDKKAISDFLRGSDYFEAPYTTEYQFSYEGGLAEYSYRVYRELTHLLETYDVKCTPYDALVVSLFHSLYKVNYYEKYVKNVKEYSPKGKKMDEMGKFDWVAQSAYKVKDAKDRYTAGNPGFTSYMILSKFLPLSEDSIMAIVYHNYDEDTKDIYELLRSFPLVTLLNIASQLVLNVLFSDVKDDGNSQNEYNVGTVWND